mmetsp:Transcript_12284/g.32138  ORF Transcript_12284/g.32138 Transcript_12284/m.32138 type:complete len:238 (+) Transcript_12284:708-1421(+)
MSRRVGSEATPARCTRMACAAGKLRCWISVSGAASRRMNFAYSRSSVSKKTCPFCASMRLKLGPSERFVSSKTARATLCLILVYVFKYAAVRFSPSKITMVRAASARVRLPTSCGRSTLPSPSSRRTPGAISRSAVVGPSRGRNSTLVTRKPCSAYIKADRPPKRPSSMMCSIPASRAAVSTARIFVGRMSENRQRLPEKQRHVFSCSLHCASTSARWAQRFQPSGLIAEDMSPRTW